MAAPNYIANPPLGDVVSWASNEFTAIERTLAKVWTFLPTRQQSGTTYTFAVGDDDYVTEFTNGSPITATVPKDATVPWGIGTVVHILVGGSGQVTIAPEDGTITVNSRPGLKSAGQYAMISLWKKAANSWIAFGDLTA